MSIKELIASSSVDNASNYIFFNFPSKAIPNKSIFFSGVWYNIVFRK